MDNMKTRYIIYLMNLEKKFSFMNRIRKVIYLLIYIFKIYVKMSKFEKIV